MAVIGYNTNNDYWALAGDVISASKATCPASGTLTDLNVVVSGLGSPGDFRLGVYSDNAGVPNSKLLDAGTVEITGAGTFSITGLSLAVTVDTVYWLTTLAYVPANLMAYNSVGTNETIRNAQAEGALPSTFPTDDPTYNTYAWEIYGTITEGGGATNVVMNII